MNFLNTNKPMLALMLMLILQVVAANKWLIIPPEVLTALSGLAAGAAVAMIPHSNAAGARYAALKKS